MAEQTEAMGLVDGGRRVGDVEFFVDVVDGGDHGCAADFEAACDFLVGEAFGNQREGDWKLYGDSTGKRAELYNVAQDRAETKELNRKHPELIARMTQSLTAWKETLPKAPNPDCVISP